MIEEKQHLFYKGMLKIEILPLETDYLRRLGNHINDIVTSVTVFYFKTILKNSRSLHTKSNTFITEDLPNQVVEMR